MWLINQDRDEFKVGDTVYIANNVVGTTECYAAYVTEVLEDKQTGGLGRHYVVIIRTHIDDYLQVREAQFCFRSKEQYEHFRSSGRMKMDQLLKKIEARRDQAYKEVVQ